jgi:hypothetical protein
MMTMAAVMAVMQLFLSLVHPHSLLGIGRVLRIVLAQAFKTNGLTKANCTRWDRLVQLAAGKLEGTEFSWGG